jgi:hypothetical protein
MSQFWRGRTVDDWLGYFKANLTDVADRKLQMNVDREAHLLLRRQSIGIRPSLALGEWDGFEVPVLAWYSSILETMRIQTIDNVIYINEIFSLEKDRARGDSNQVLFLINDGLSEQEAVRDICLKANVCVERFLSLELRIPQLCDELRLSPQERSAVEQYVDLMRTWMRGHLDWEFACGRYTAEAIQMTGPDGPGLLNFSGLGR